MYFMFDELYLSSFVTRTVCFLMGLIFGINDSGIIADGSQTVAFLVWRIALMRHYWDDSRLETGGDCILVTSSPAGS